jgi:hypothetical protein
MSEINYFGNGLIPIYGKTEIPYYRKQFTNIKVRAKRRYCRLFNLSKQCINIFSAPHMNNVYIMVQRNSNPDWEFKLLDIFIGLDKIL